MTTSASGGVSYTMFPFASFGAPVKLPNRLSRSTYAFACSATVLYFSCLNQAGFSPTPSWFSVRFQALPLFGSAAMARGLVGFRDYRAGGSQSLRRCRRPVAPLSLE